MRASISLGRIAGIKVGINASVFLIIAILVAGLATGQLPAAFPGRSIVAYVIAATTAHGLMARPVAGAVNVAMVAGLGQFLTTFLLTWAYARHARLRRDRAALELRWDTQEMTRGIDR